MERAEEKGWRKKEAAGEGHDQQWLYHAGYAAENKSVQYQSELSQPQWEICHTRYYTAGKRGTGGSVCLPLPEWSENGKNSKEVFDIYKKIYGRVRKRAEQVDWLE